MYDCPGKEDEGECDDYTCPQYYRCRASVTCLHPFYLCDGKSHCPQKDDELLCGMSCPEQCICLGLALTCTLPFAAAVYPGIRYLDASGSGMTPFNLSSNRMLIYLDLSHCDLNHVDILKFPNLISLDLSYNALTDIDIEHFYHSPTLRQLMLSGNPISSLFTRQSQGTVVLESLEHLDIFNVKMKELNTSVVKYFINLQVINMSFSGIQRLVGSHFHVLRSVHTFDLRGCPLTSFDPQLFMGLTELHTLYVDNYKLCCPHFLPVDFNVNHCHGPKDVLSSCDSLLGSAPYRAIFAVLTAVGFLSHFLSIVLWVFLPKDGRNFRFYVFLMHMTVCDLLMGLHKAIVVIADHVYSGHYAMKDTAWRRSVMCQVSSFVFFLSTDVSAFLTSLMTLDRCASLRFPRRYVRVSATATNACCLMVWAGGLLLSSVSLLPWTSDEELKGQTGACQPLVALLTDPESHEYTLAALAVLTLVLLIITCAGQLYVAMVMWKQDSILVSLQTGHTVSNEFTLSNRVFTLVLFHVLCGLWSSLCIILTSAGISVSSDVQSGSLLLVMPLKSALNPCMNLIGHVQERQRQTQRKRLIQRLGLTKQ